MASSLPYDDVMKTPRPGELTTPKRKLKTAPAVSLWRPEIVLANSTDVARSRRPVVLAEPGARPEALHTQFDNARSLLASLGKARQTLGAAASAARARAADAGTERDRVSATFAAYRAEAALDDVLTGAWRRVSALMEERGLR
jgi:hypothetical protein